MDSIHLCSLCVQRRASFFCTCASTETFLCEHCFPDHFTKSFPQTHHNYPISAYGHHRTAGYFDRLQARLASFATGKQELLKSLAAVDQCISEFSAEANNVIAILQNYKERTVEELRKLKESLEVDINIAIGQVESTMYEEGANLSQLAKWLRDGGGAGMKSLFHYFVFVSDDLPKNALKLICTTEGVELSAVQKKLPFGVSSLCVKCSGKFTDQPEFQFCECNCYCWTCGFMQEFVTRDISGLCSNCFMEIKATNRDRVLGMKANCVCSRLIDFRTQGLFCDKSGHILCGKCCLWVDGELKCSVCYGECRYREDLCAPEEVYECGACERSGPEEIAKCGHMMHRTCLDQHISCERCACMPSNIRKG